MGSRGIYLPTPFVLQRTCQTRGLYPEAGRWPMTMINVDEKNLICNMGGGM